jgi:methionyl-tRNA formyltransferase
VERAILEDDAETGVCLMAVEAGLDTGGIYAVAATAIEPEETAAELRSRLVTLGCRLLDDHLGGGRAGLPLPRDQAGVPSYAEKILPGELEIHWEEPADRIHRVVRVGRAWTTFRGRRLGVVAASRVPEEGGRAAPVGEPGTLEGTEVVTGHGSRLRLVTVHPEGRRAMDAAEWARGVRPAPGEGLGPVTGPTHR